MQGALHSFVSFFQNLNQLPVIKNCDLKSTKKSEKMYWSEEYIIYLWDVTE